MKQFYRNLFGFLSVVKNLKLLTLLFLTNFAFAQNVDVTATVGTVSGSYATLGAAVAAINSGTHKGVIAIQIKANTTETGTGISLLASGTGSSSYTAISIQPSGGLARSVSGTITAGNPLLNFNGADNVTIDGLNSGGDSLTFTNTTVSATSGTSTIRFINDATNNKIQNCTIQGATTDTSAGVVFFSTAGSLNGNDGNFITGNFITNATGRPLNAIYSAGTAAKENSGNTINNNNIFNTFNLTTASNGIQLAANNTAWSISGNSFYETATFTPTQSVAYTAINVSDVAATAITVSGNFIGGNAASCGGTFTKAFSSNTSNAFTGISINGGGTNEIQGNTVKNISWINFDGADWTGIAIITGAANVGTTTGNVIGDTTGTGSITVNNNGNGNVNFYGINITTTGFVDCQKNTIGSVNANGSGASVTNFYGINKNATSGNITISNNTIGSLTTPLSINATGATSNPQFVYGINVMPNNTSSITIDNNKIANMRNATLETNTARINGIAVLGDANAAPNTITNNTIFDLTIGNNSSAAGFNASVSGIAFTANGFFVKSRILTGNTIYNLSNTHASFAGNIYGIYYDGAAASGNTVSRNFIHDLSVASTSTAATIYGIYMFGGGTTFSNNVIALGGNTPTTIYGIYDVGDRAHDFFTYYNTISISGNPTSGSNKSYGIFSGYAGGGKDIRNNVISNTRSTVGGSNLHFGLYLNYYTPLGGTFKVNNNNYYTPGTGGVAGYWSALNQATAPIVTGELNSFSTNPYFDQPDRPAATALAADYKISEAALKAVIGTGITTDYAGTTRSVTTPVMGAFEALLPYIGVTPIAITTFHYESGAGPSHELTTKVFGLNLGSSNISITPPTNYEISLTSGGAFVATNPITLTQIAGSVASTTIYIRLKAGLADGTYAPENIVCTATGATTRNIACNGRVGDLPVIYTSTLELNNLSYVTTGPSLPQSYVVSGKFLTANIIITPPTVYEVSLSSGSGYLNSLSLTPTSGNVANTTIYVRLKAGNPFGSYDNKVLTNTSTGAYTEFITLNGTVTSAVQVWKSSVLQTSYPSLKGTFDKINDGTHKGSLELRIAGSTAETAPAVLNASGAGSASYTDIKIYPINTGLSISGAFPLTELIDLNGADNVTIDGRLNATGTTKDLTINNTSTVANASTIRFINDATFNIVKYCIIKGATTGTNYGIVYFSTAGSGSGNDKNLIDNNTITNSTNTTRPYNALSSLGTSSAKDNSNNTVSNNNFVDFFSSTYFGFGVNIAANNSTWTISGNSFYETTSEKFAAAYTYKAISIDDTNGVGFVVSGNYIGGNAPLAAGMWTKPNTSYNNFIGINVKVGTSQNTTIVKNVIKNMSWLNNAEAAWTGIVVDGGNVVIGTGTGNGNTIGAATGTGSITFSAQNLVKVKGIEILSTGTVDCQNNTIGSIIAGNNGAAGRTDFYGILKSATAGDTTISKNLIGSLTTAISIDATCANTNGGQEVYGIISQGSGNIIIDGNTVANLNHRNTTAIASGIINGIRVTAGSANTITNNTVGDLTIANVGGTGRDASITGINLNNTSIVKTVTGNTIYNLSNPRSDYAGNVNGLYFEGNTGANVISKNFIRDLFVPGISSTAASIYGINIASGAVTYANNVISLGGDTKTTLYGIYDTGASGQTFNLYFNTIYIGGSLDSGTTNKSYCIFSAAAANTRNFRNNILRNERSTVAGASLHYTVSQTANTNLTSDYNNYTVTGVGGAIGFLTSDRVTLANWQTATGQDANSISVDPNFVNVPSTVPADYKLYRRNFPGVTGTGITDDFESVSRGATPNMGAFQNFVVPPVETFVNNVSQYGYLTLKRAFDHINLGIYKGTSLLPLSIKINANTTETATAVLNASGTNGSLYDAIKIFPTFTGLSITGNLNAPIIDLNGADNVTLDGRVNATGTATDLSVVNTSTSNVAGTSTIRLFNDASTNTIQYCTVAGSGTSITSGTVFFSTGTTTGNNTNTINNCNITAAGSNLPTNGLLSIGTSAAINNSGNTITNNNIQDYFSPTATSYGIGVLAFNAAWTITGNKLFQTATRTVTSNGASNFGIGITSTTAGGYTVNNNVVGYANSSGTGTTIYDGAFTSKFIGINANVDGNVTTIQNNTIANSTSSSTISGVVLSTIGATATLNVNANTIITLSSTGASAIVSGLEIVSGLGTVNIFSNTINAITGTGTTSPTANGIAISGGATVGVYKNKIYDIAQNGTNAGATVNGLNITGGTNVTVYNNLIGDLKAPATSNNFAINGIFSNSSTASTASNLYYNTINIAATSSGTNFGTSGIRHNAVGTATTGALDMRNNIIINTSTPAGSGKTIALSRTAITTANYATTSKNNLFYAGVAGANNLIYSDGLYNDLTLAAFKTRNTALEINSQSGIVTFLSTTGSSSDFLKTNFTDDPTATLINGKAVAIATFTDDFVGTVRQTVPDIGAYESICNVTQLVVTPSGTVTICSGPQLLTATVVEPNAVYLWKKDGVVVGTNSSTYNATVSGSYTVEYAFCGAPSTSAATIIAINIPSAPTVASQGVCTGATIADLVATGTAIKWYAAASGGSALLTTDSVIATTYYATQTVSTCESPRAAAVITLNPLPTVSLPAITIVCPNRITSITATGNANTYTWVSSVAGTLFSDAAATIAYVPLANATTVYLKTASIGTVTATGSITATSCTDTSITTVSFVVPSTTYDGSTWSGGLPDYTKSVLFSAGTYNMSSDIEACNCTVNGGIVTFDSGVNLKVVNAVTVSSGSLTFKDSASLIQISNATNAGAITYERATTSLKQYDFHFWSSPVANQNIGGIWMNTRGETFYTWNTISESWSVKDGTLSMLAATGYIARARDTYPVWSAGTPYTALFFGVPNNGNYDFTIIKGGTGVDKDQNFIGNPYPSAIDIQAFWNDTDNNSKLTGFFNFWTHINPLTNNKYNIADYAVYSAALNTGTASINGGTTPTRNVAAGQGFFALANNVGGTVTFKNSHRVVSNNAAVFRTTGSKNAKSLPESHKIWLNFSNSQGAFKQQLLTYTAGATNDFDVNYDYPSLDSNSYIDFYSIANNKKYTIQSKEVSFEADDVVPLGFKSAVAETFQVSIDHFDGLFARQNVYLQDNLLGLTHDLKQSSYSFTTGIGTFDNRFVLKYTNQTLGVNTPVNLEDNIIVTSQNPRILVKSFADTIDKITVFDLLGKKLFSKNKISAKEFLIENIVSGKTTLIVKIKLENGSVVSRKIIY